MKFVATTALLAAICLAGAPAAFAQAKAKAEKMEKMDSKSDKKNIVEVAVANGSFKTLVKLVGDAGLADALSGKGPLTVFAPTDDAFAKVPADALAALGKDKEKLAAVLKYHVVSGKVAAADAIKMDGKSAKTLNGAEIKITVVDGKVKINDATVATADVEASNGVIHIIDTVLMPPAAADKM